MTLLLLFKLGLQFKLPLAMRTTYARHEQNIYNWITAIFRQKELIMFFGKIKHKEDWYQIQKFTFRVYMMINVSTKYFIFNTEMLFINPVAKIN